MMDVKEIELQVLITEREGMVAENQNRTHRGLALVYTEIQFFNLAEKMRQLK